NFTADIIQAARRASGGGIDSGPHSIGSVSAEFRGLSVTLSEHVRREEIREPLTEYIREPGWSDRYGTMEGKIDATRFGDDEALGVIDEIWPFITSDPAHGHAVQPDPLRVHRARKIEYTASSFLGQRYIYCTALGPQPLNQPTPAPVCYFVIGKSG